MKHSIKKNYKRMVDNSDCYLYEIICDCGVVFSDWSINAVEKEFKSHAKTMRDEI